MISPLLDGLLNPKHVLLDLRGKTAGEAIWEIVEVLRESGELNKATEFFQAVMAREEKTSTVANGAVAFPHVRTDLVDEILLGIGRSARGISFGDEENLVHLIFLIAVPQQMVNDYLICVGGLARRLSKDATRQALREASTPAEFLERLRADE
ncbi:MAG: PTS sugar transporter subunit IIA [Verrucomicrobiota bacterium]|nr:PTS sugar transporter subunit IIA [Chthoniobacterales bacterium]MDQ3413630.1 PTS sugar transporter subunit IIA [Verrucomicrobiota bacterium]